MAKITLNSIVNSKPVYQLMLSEREIKTLYCAICCVGGNSENTARKYIDSIRSAIRNNFHLAKFVEEFAPEILPRGTIYFLDDPFETKEERFKAQMKEVSRDLMVDAKEMFYSTLGQIAETHKRPNIGSDMKKFSVDDMIERCVDSLFSVFIDKVLSEVENFSKE